MLNDAVRLRYGYVIRADEVVKDAAGNIQEIRATLDVDTLGQNPEGYKPRGVIHWVSATHNVPCQVRLYDRLFTEVTPDRVADGGSFMDSLNPQSRVVLDNALADVTTAEALPETSFQFEREGYFVVDPDSTAERKVFNLTVSLKESF